jgi:hypothetical protein
MSKRNAGEIAEIIALVKSKFGIFHGLLFMRNAREHSFGVPANWLSDFDPANGLLEVEEMEGLADLVCRKTDNARTPLLDSIVKTVDHHVLSILKNRQPALRCRAGCVDGVIYANGDVALCEFTRPFANLKDFDYNFRELWHSPRSAQARLAIKNCFCAHPCNLITSMRYDWRSLNRLFA